MGVVEQFANRQHKKLWLSKTRNYGEARQETNHPCHPDPGVRLLQTKRQDAEHPVETRETYLQGTYFRPVRILRDSRRYSSSSPGQNESWRIREVAKCLVFSRPIFTSTTPTSSSTVGGPSPTSTR